jgi:hypothetical protein
VDLRDETLRSGLSIRDAIFLDPVYLSYLRSDRDIDFSGSTFIGGLKADHLQVNGSFYLGTGKDLGYTGSNRTMPAYDRYDQVSRIVVDNCATILKRGYLYYSHFIDLSKTVITGELNITSLASDTALRLFSAQIKNIAVIQDSCINSVEISYATVGQFEFRGAKLGGDLASPIPEKVDLVEAPHRSLPIVDDNRNEFVAEGIKGYLSLNGAVLRHLDLTGSKIGVFRLGKGNAPNSLPLNIWRNDPKFSNTNPRLRLDHAQVGTT